MTGNGGATRRGLVIGAGGVSGLAWSAATLVALEEATGWDPRNATLMLGTSQGSLLTSLLASGIGTADLVGWYRRQLPDTHPLRAKPAHDRARAKASRLGAAPRPGSPMLLRHAVGRDRIPALAVLAGLLPEGTSSLDAFLAPLTALVGDQAWVGDGATRVVAVDYDTGRRVCFGAPGAPSASIVDAVRASCSVPRSFPPVRVDGRRYVDGGVHSTTNADLLADAELDEVVVLAPMAGPAATLLPRSPADTVSRLLGRTATRQLKAEVRRLTEAGIRVHVLSPSGPDRAVMGANPLDPHRRFAIFEAALQRAPVLRVADWHDPARAAGGHPRGDLGSRPEPEPDPDALDM